MTTPDTLTAERAQLGSLLEAIQRCVFFLEASRAKLDWPLTATTLAERYKDVPLFESLAAMNERFAKLQDTLGAALRHAALLAGEPTDTFLRTLAFYEKIGVLPSLDDWQLARTTRNLAAHAYDTDYAAIADHCNALHSLTPGLYGIARRFVAYCRDQLGIAPATDDFSTEFDIVTASGGRATPDPR